MTDLPGLQPEDLIVGDKAAKIVWIKVKEAVGLLWGDNPKEHDIGGIVESIQKYGFQEVPIFDTNLKSDIAPGGIKAGNGRTYALGVMEAQKLPVPAGIAQVKDTGEWVMPLLVGIDADSKSIAEAYAIDSNNLTMAGGDFSPVDYMRMWDSNKYLKLLIGLGNEGQLPVTVNGDNLDMLLAYTAGPKSLEDLGDELGEPTERETWPSVRVQVEPETQELFTELMQAAPAIELHRKFRMLLDCVDTAALADYPKDGK